MSVTKDIIDGFSNIVKDRIGHPFFGAFISTFIVCNFDILIDLFVNINDPFAVIFFKSVLYGESYYRIGLPLFTMFLFPLYIHNTLKKLYSHFHEKTKREIENMKESENNKIYRIEAETYKQKYLTSLTSIEESIQKSMTMIDYILNLLEKDLNNYEYLAIFESDDTLKVNQYVSYIEKINRIIPYYSKEMFLGEVKHQITNNLYIVKIIHTDYLNQNFSKYIKETTEYIRDLVLDHNGVTFQNHRGVLNTRTLGSINPDTKHIRFNEVVTNSRLFTNKIRNFTKKIIEDQAL